MAANRMAVRVLEGFNLKECRCFCTSIYLSSEMLDRSRAPVSVGSYAFPVPIVPQHQLDTGIVGEQVVSWSHAWKGYTGPTPWNQPESVPYAVWRPILL